jgi:hypothetical protein
MTDSGFYAFAKDSRFVATYETSIFLVDLQAMSHAMKLYVAQPRSL